jgi:transcriptional regulator with GAF, ATPase, and Fis domain
MSDDDFPGVAPEKGPTIVGSSPALHRVLDLATHAAAKSVKVAITGESGVGKDVLARYIHAHSARASKPFVALNCAGIAETLLESELFGHVRGSFTGAYRDKVGCFELAHQGTVFLDEIGDMGPRMQGLLLRFLETGEIRRVGSDTASRHVDVRIISATNRNLYDMVRKGQFREDLYYRVHVVQLEVPPLRDRKDDIRALLDHMAAKAGEPLVFSDAALRLLEAYRWPGNVRELQNVVERAVILSQGSSLRLHLQSSPARESRASSPPPSSAARLATREDLKRQERENILHALRLTKGRIFGAHGAAELLGMKPTTLTSRLKALGIKKSKPNS